MNWYFLAKTAALPDDWWRNFQFHFQKVIEIEFPKKVNIVEPNPDREPALCVGEWVTGPTSTQFFRTSFGQNDLTFNFKLAAKNQQYICTIKLVFGGYIAHNLGYSKGNVAMNKPIDAPFRGAQILVQRKNYKTGRFKTLGVDNPDKAAYISIPLDDAAPAILIKKVKQMVDEDNPDDGEGGDNSGSPNDSPSPKTYVPSGSPLVEV